MYVQIRIQSEDDHTNYLSPSMIGLRASLDLFKAALSGVLRSPTSFFDTTPMGINYITVFLWPIDQLWIGRIFSRLSKDQDTIDQELPMVLMQVRNRILYASAHE